MFFNYNVNMIAVCKNEGLMSIEKQKVIAQE